MKQVYIILLALLFGYQQTNAQAINKLESFKMKVLPEYNMYFEHAELTENGQLNLSAVDKYITLSSDDKKAIMVIIAKSWGESLVLVHYGSKSELWGWNAQTGNTNILDEWDLNVPRLMNSQPVKAQMPVYHPWFIYIGGQFGGDNQKNINLSLNTRVGFFLLMNRWDFATTLSAGVSGNVDDTGTPWANLGLMTRVHFPIRKLGISPNIGGEISLVSFGGTQSTTKSLLIGISWFVGFGSLDIGVKLGKEISTVGGLTIAPGAKHNR
jgi:hypothetical protein